MAPAYAVAIALETAGTLGVIVALVLIRRERLSKAARLRRHFGAGDPRGSVMPPIVTVPVYTSRFAARRDGEETARTALRRASLAA